MRTKKTRSTAEVSSPFTALAARLSTWRNAGRPGRRIPEALWHGAVELAAAHGLSPASSSLKLNYYQLQRRLNSGRPVPKEPGVPPGFVALPAPPLSLATAGVDGGSLELVRPSGCRITLRWPGARPQELLALVQEFLHS